MNTDESKNKENISRKQRKEEMRAKREELYTKVFGVRRGEYLGNIWGWKFSILSLIGLLIIGGIAIFGIATGRIDWREQMLRKPSEELEKQRSEINKIDPVSTEKNDTLKLQ